MPNAQVNTIHRILLSLWEIQRKQIKNAVLRKRESFRMDDSGAYHCDSPERNGD